MSRAARRARAMSFSSRTPSTTSLSVPSITAAGEAAACSKKAKAVGYIVGSITSRMCASEPIARSSIQRADSQTRAMARTSHRRHDSLGAKA
eukprot:5521340-Pleurochrysis_carterae.AAC.1